MNSSPLRWIQSRLADPATRFSVTLVGYLALIGLLFNRVAVEYQAPLLNEGARHTAYLVYQVLGLFSSDVDLIGHAITFKDFSATVIVECVGALEILIFLAAVLAYPSGWRANVAGFVLGPILIIGFNVLRLATLLALGHYFPNVFDFFHVYLWQTTLIVLIAVLWLLWLRVFVRS